MAGLYLGVQAAGCDYQAKVAGDGKSSSELIEPEVFQAAGLRK